ncbi:MAG: helix-turn-helix domain-containing protein [Myxococcaceae bacterium]
MTTVLVGPQNPEAKTAEGLESLAEVERRHIMKVLEAVDGNRTQASAILGIDRKTLYRRLEQYRAEGMHS